MVRLEAMQEVRCGRRLGNRAPRWSVHWRTGRQCSRFEPERSLANAAPRRSSAAKQPLNPAEHFAPPLDAADLCGMPGLAAPAIPLP